MGRQHDLTSGGTVAYYMTSPEGEKSLEELLAMGWRRDSRVPWARSTPSSRSSGHSRTRQANVMMARAMAAKCARNPAIVNEWNISWKPNQVWLICGHLVA